VVKRRQAHLARLRRVHDDLVVVLRQDLIGYPRRPKRWNIRIKARRVAGSAEGGIALPWQRHPAADGAGHLIVQRTAGLKRDAGREGATIIRFRFTRWPQAKTERLLEYTGVAQRPCHLTAGMEGVGETEV